MSHERLLDVSDLPPPEPMEQILSTLDTLEQGQYLRVSHRREPWPLFPIIEQQGYAHFMRAASPGGFEIFIWLSDDAATEDHLQRHVFDTN